MGKCLSPFKAANPRNGLTMSIPCGRCPDCLKRRVSGWSFRLMQQDKVSEAAYFLTLTIDSDHLQFTPKRYMTLVKRDLQAFMKRLRDAQPVTHYDYREYVCKRTGKVRKRKIPVYMKLKYYAVGEYGSKKWRPHYHMIIFAEYEHFLTTLIGEANYRLVQNGYIDLDGKYHFVSDVWKLGTVTIGQVEQASVGYTLKYVCKPKRIPLHQNDDRLPEFSLMSKKLGRNYVDDPLNVKWHRADLNNRMYLPLSHGKKAAMPRYYKEAIYELHERVKIGNLMHLSELNNDNNHVLSEQNRIDLLLQRTAALKHVRPDDM